MVKQPCPSESDRVTEEDKSKKRGQEEKEPKKQFKKDEKGQKEEKNQRKKGKQEVEFKRKNLAKTGVTSTSDSEEERKERKFQTAHGRNMLKGQPT